MSYQKATVKNNYLSGDVGLEFDNFIEFFNYCKDKLPIVLKKVHNAQHFKGDVETSLTEWDGRNDEIDEQEYKTLEVLNS
ncbi:hypothetical protein HNV12_06670 [Methanococcoides sp. SA1]|nr:hypothetical protein [Methanococcoides sp. SA1]